MNLNNSNEHNEITKGDKPTEVVSSKCLDLHIGGLVLIVPLEVPCRDVHLAPGPSEEHAGKLLGLLLGCHPEVGTSQILHASR